MGSSPRAPVRGLESCQELLTSSSSSRSNPGCTRQRQRQLSSPSSRSGSLEFLLRTCCPGPTPRLCAPARGLGSPAHEFLSSSTRIPHVRPRHGCPEFYPAPPCLLQRPRPPRLPQQGSRVHAPVPSSSCSGPAAQALPRASAPRQGPRPPVLHDLPFSTRAHKSSAPHLESAQTRGNDVQQW